METVERVKKEHKKHNNNVNHRNYSSYFGIKQREDIWGKLGILFFTFTTIGSFNDSLIIMLSGSQENVPLHLPEGKAITEEVFPSAVNFEVYLHLPIP